MYELYEAINRKMASAAIVGLTIGSAIVKNVLI
jgi:hypothetical protein